MTVTKFAVEGHVAYITLNRPEAMNALNPQHRFELSQHFDEVERRDDIWLAVMTGAGERAFCAGADLKHRALQRTATTNKKLNGWRWRPKQHPSINVGTFLNLSSPKSTDLHWGVD